MKKLICLLIACFFLTGCMGANYYYKKGQVEFQEQNYHQAFADTLAAAKYGNVEAQYAAGYMYYYGIGTEQNDYLAEMWFAKSAAIGEPKSIAALKQVKKTAENPLLFGIDKQQAAPPPHKPSQAQIHANAPVLAHPHPKTAPAATTTKPAKPKSVPHYNPHAGYKTQHKKTNKPVSTKRLPPIPAPHTTYTK
ncbi:MAG: hypothetical protein P1U34_10815 [Coxiellaceae bacterium]|nr:hypothetical protein [Coxiellaceae bacterium]